MSDQKLDRSFVPNKKDINYLNKNFPQYRRSLIDFAKVYFPDTYNDFNESSPGMMFIEMSAYVGDVLSYYMDTQFRENLMQYAEEEDNVIAIAQSMGFRPKPTTASKTDLDVYQIVPALDVMGGYEPDPDYLLRIAPGMIVSAPQFSVQFRTIELVDFASPVGREITVHSTDGMGNPKTYLVRKRTRVVSGVVRTFTQAFEAPRKFSRITLPEQNAVEVISVRDGRGFRWHQVDFLAQDLVFEDVINTAGSGNGESPFYVIRPRRTPRRFVTRYNSNFQLELMFGSGVSDVDTETVEFSPEKLVSSEYEGNLASTSIDPSDFLNNKTYGLAPSNTTLEVTYSVGGGIDSNVPSNSITKIDTVDIMNDRSAFESTSEQELYDDIVGSLAVVNPMPATGGKDGDTIEEIRQNALAFFNSQNRLVTAEDYQSRCFAMPGKYGGVAKVFVARDEQINSILRKENDLAPYLIGDEEAEFVDNNVAPNIVNLYVLGYDNRTKLTRLNKHIKKNLRTYLENYRILTDEIRILDGFVINIAVDFRIVVYRGYNMNEVLARAMDSVREFFDVSRWKINQPIVLNDLQLEISKVEGVQNVDRLKILNRYSFRDGADYENYLYDIDAATENGIVYPSLDPSIFELRYPDKDIIASAIQ